MIDIPRKKIQVHGARLRRETSAMMYCSVQGTLVTTSVFLRTTKNVAGETDVPYSFSLSGFGYSLLKGNLKFADIFEALAMPADRTNPLPALAELALLESLDCLQVTLFRKHIPGSESNGIVELKLLGGVTVSNERIKLGANNPTLLKDTVLRHYFRPLQGL